MYLHTYCGFGAVHANNKEQPSGSVSILCGLERKGSGLHGTHFETPTPLRSK